PPWTTDWITPEGRRKLAEHGIAPPGPAPRPAPGPVPLVLSATRRAVPCPRCGAADTEETSRFGATSCKALWRCRACREPFEYLKEI
ncbi:1,2-phenylacetyl-CoA epoxidase subunit PaaD, partial [Streptomyces hygroscopicus]